MSGAALVGDDDPRWRSGEEPMRRRTRETVGIAVFAALVSVIAFIAYFDARDPFHLDRERAQRRVAASLGRPLPGTPDLDVLDRRLAESRLILGAPVHIRIFKAEFELELWMLRDGRFVRLATYPICRWSGGLGPKLREGDRQAPEGFYMVDAGALNPNSRWHRSFNIGFPNALDRAHGRTGTFLMVHGGCGSVGCYAMTDPVIDEIWRIVTAALGKGQARIPLHIFPFRMTDANMALVRDHPWIDFWRDLKAGHDHFEATLLPPRVTVCGGRYQFQSAVDLRAAMAPVDQICPAVRASARPAAGR
jgi:murein L,D-transpeptidase YafK